MNKVVVYDEVFEAFHQDLNIDFIKKIYDKDIHEINIKNNAVVCKSWASLYTYFLNKKGIEAVISHSGIHQYVTVKTQGKLFRADAILSLFDNTDKTSMNDLTRAKLGLKPQGFSVIQKDPELGVTYQNIYDSKILIDPRLARQFANLDSNTTALMQQLKEQTSFKMAEIPEEYQKLEYRFALIDQLLLEKKLDRIGGISYLNTLIRNLLSKEEQKHVSYAYIKEYDGSNYHYTELINYAKEEQDVKKMNSFSSIMDGINFIYRGNGLEFSSEKKVNKLRRINDQIDMEMLNGKGRSR